VTLDTFQAVALDPGLALLPAQMDTLEARGLLLATALHESQLAHRKQVSGPARGYFQFERSGVHGVLYHPASRDLAAAVLVRLDYGQLTRRSREVCNILEHQDVLAVVIARLLFWTLPAALPRRDQAAVAYEHYLQAWRPNAEKAAHRRQEWAINYSVAWQFLLGGHD
jgi:hypothetical protein